jgi:type IV pilus assembly protein PilA
MVRNVRKGFTLIELLIVVVIIGILAAVAIPKFANTKEKAYISSMKSDLKNLQVAQESYADDYKAYKAVAAKATLVDANGKTYWAPSAGNEVVVVTPSTTGWKAHIKNSTGATKVQCAVFVGDSAANVLAGYEANEGEPKCKTP